MEKTTKPVNGYFALVLSIATLALSIYAFMLSPTAPAWLWLAIPALLVTFIIWKGLKIVQPNHAQILNLFGKYMGSIKDNGIFFVNPLFITYNLSLRAQNLSTPTLKVNDKMGNPIEIAAVVVWQIKDTYKAAYDVADYLSYVRTQSEAAIRNLASRFSYDNIEDESAGITLREGGQKVHELLEQELHERLAIAGVTIIEARISHLAYAQEIAGAMLQRQQATAIVAARYKIVEGAVGMVEMALDELGKKNIVEMDQERKAAMVSNLMVVLCGEKAAQPILNTGTLYQ